MVEIIDHVGYADVPPICKLVVHEVHRLGLIDMRLYHQRLRHPAHQLFAWLDRRVEFEFAVDLIHALLVLAKALHIAQV